MKPQELQLVPTETLIMELMTRFHHAAFIGRIDRGDANIWSRRWKGDRDVCSGLVVSLLTTVDKQGREEETTLPPGSL